MTETTRTGKVALAVIVEGDPAHAETAAQTLTRDLRALRGLGRVERLAGNSAPSGSKGTTTGFGDILIALGSAGGLVPALAQLLRDWIGRQRKPTSIVVTIGDRHVEITADMTAEQIGPLLTQAASIVESK